VKVALVLNGDEPGPDELKLLDACEAIVAADGAAEKLLRSDRPPSVIVGDLDSLGPDAYKWADALNIPMERHRADKDETDGELALQKALQMGAKSLLILGAHGGRSAMFLANLKLLRRAHEKGLEAVINGHGESIRFVSAGGELALVGRTNSILNILAVDGPAKVAISGTAFDSPELDLDPRSARGVSNRITSDGARVKVLQGTVVVVVERKPKSKNYEIV
jgi:thiamine pyrophosphokinase